MMLLKSKHTKNIFFIINVFSYIEHLYLVKVGKDCKKINFLIYHTKNKHPLRVSFESGFIENTALIFTKNYALALCFA